MGILDDVTHSGDEPEITTGSAAVAKEMVFFEIPVEDVDSLKEWLSLATDEEKEVVVDGPVTKVFYTHPKLAARPILVAIRKKMAELFKTDPEFLPRISKYHTIAYSNAESFTYTNTVYLDSETVDEEIQQYKMYIVLDGSLRTDSVPGTVFSKAEVYCMLTDPCTEELSNSGEEDSLILCFTLA
jgi:hypothetical protein